MISHGWGYPMVNGDCSKRAMACIFDGMKLIKQIPKFTFRGYIDQNRIIEFCWIFSDLHTLIW